MLASARKGTTSRTFIDEVGEQKAAEKLIDVVGDAFERIVPEDVQDVLQASSSGAPTTIESPSMATEEPNLSLVSAPAGEDS